MGLNYAIIMELMDHRGLTPEPVDLKSQDLSKLEEMQKRGEVSYDEYEFLKAIFL